MNVLLENQVVGGTGECDGECFFCRLVCTRKNLLAHPCDAVGRTLEALSVRILANSLKKQAHSLFHLHLVNHNKIKPPIQ